MMFTSLEEQWIGIIKDVKLHTEEKSWKGNILANIETQMVCTLNGTALKNGLAWPQKQTDRVIVQEFPTGIPLPKEENFFCARGMGRRGEYREAGKEGRYFLY